MNETRLRELIDRHFSLCNTVIDEIGFHRTWHITRIREIANDPDHKQLRPRFEAISHAMKVKHQFITEQHADIVRSHLKVADIRARLDSGLEQKVKDEIDILIHLSSSMVKYVGSMQKSAEDDYHSSIKLINLFLE